MTANLEHHEERRSHVRRGQILEYLTVGYNCLEGLIAVGAGLTAGSTALIVFGFDSVSTPLTPYRTTGFILHPWCGDDDDR